jgi:hypothetical protein
LIINHFQLFFDGSTAILQFVENLRVRGRTRNLLPKPWLEQPTVREYWVLPHQGEEIACGAGLGRVNSQPEQLQF